MPLECVVLVVIALALISMAERQMKENCKLLLIKSTNINTCCSVLFASVSLLFSCCLFYSIRFTLSPV